MDRAKLALAVALDPMDLSHVCIFQHRIYATRACLHYSLTRTAGLFIIMVPLLMTETRATVLLMRKARKLRKQTGNPRYRARIEDELPSLRTLIYMSCTRPLCGLPCRTSFIIVHVC